MESLDESHPRQVVAAVKVARRAEGDRHASAPRVLQHATERHEGVGVDEGDGDQIDLAADGGLEVPLKGIERESVT